MSDSDKGYSGYEVPLVDFVKPAQCPVCKQEAPIGEHRQRDGVCWLVYQHWAGDHGAAHIVPCKEFHKKDASAV